MTKKKALAAVLVVALVACIAVGASLAYLTDNDSADNTFTVGNVKIDLIEQQRAEDDDGNKTETLEDFEQNKILLPIVGSAQGESDGLGLPTAANYVDKICTVKNTGASDAWVRFYFAIPSALDDGYETFNAGLNILHFNFGNENGASTFGNTWKWMDGGKWNYFETTIDRVAYNVYYADYMKILSKDETTTQAVIGVYLDKSFDVVTGTDGSKTYRAFNKDIQMTGMIGDDGNVTVTCPVYAVAVQAAGFDDAATAIKDAFGAKYNPWGTDSSHWQTE